MKGRIEIPVEWKPGYYPQMRILRVRGITFRNPSKELWDSLKLFETHVFRLEREPDNPHDPHAVKVYAKDFFIGYIWKEQSYMASFLMSHYPDHWTILFHKSPYKTPSLSVQLCYLVKNGDDEPDEWDKQMNEERAIGFR